MIVMKLKTVTYQENHSLNSPSEAIELAYAPPEDILLSWWLSVLVSKRGILVKDQMTGINNLFRQSIVQNVINLGESFIHF